jgi:hypothetical protein
VAHALPVAFSEARVTVDVDLAVEFRELLEAPFDFVRQPDPVAASLRPERRVPLVLLLVAKSHGSGASWKGLQLLNWAVRHPEHAELLVAFQDERDIPDRPVVRFEPVLDRALDLAAGLGLLEQKTSRVFRLTQAGRNAVAEIEASDALLRERELLAALRGKITQTQVRRVLEWRDA